MNDVSSTPNTAASPGDLDEFLGAPPARPWYKRPMTIVIAVVVVLGLLLLSRCFAGKTEGSYATAPVQRGSLTVTVSATGNLQPTNEVTVGSEESGLVTEVYVDNNDQVKKGQPLAKLDTLRLHDAVVQAQASLAANQAQVANARATLVQDQANLARLEEVFKVSGGKVPSKTELDTGRAEAQRAVAGVKAAQAQVAQAQAALSTAQVNISKATIYSPVNGVVLSRSIDPGATVAASFQTPTLFTIAEDLSKMKLEVKVDEADVGQVQSGQRATFTVDAYPGQTFPAVIQRVDVGANAASGSSTTTTTASASSSTVVAYTAVLTVANPDFKLRPGMTATADIITTQRNNVLLVPNAALRFSPAAGARGGQSGGITSALVPQRGRLFGNRANREVTIGRGSKQTVYVLGDDGKPKPVQVTVGDTNGTMTEVTGGLQPGQKVIVGQLASDGKGGSSGGTRAAGGNRAGGAAGARSGGGGNG